VRLRSRLAPLVPVRSRGRVPMLVRRCELRALGPFRHLHLRVSRETSALGGARINRPL